MKKIINYSGIAGLVLISALFFLPFSCNKDTVENNPNADSNSQLIKVSGEDANAATKTTLNLLVTSWVANNDFVGIYSPQARPTSGGSASVTNRKYIATTSASSSAFSPASGNEMYWGTTNPHLFYAYYPYSASAGTDATLVPITLATGQTQSAGGNSTHIGDLDFLVATPVSQAPGGENTSTSINLRYNHVFTVLEFQIKRSSGSGKITKLKLTAPTTNLSLTSGTINITTGTPGAGVPYTISSPIGTKEITLTITGGVTPTADYATTPKIYMMILPGDFSAENMTIGLEYESSGVFENTDKTGKIFERGKKYVVQMDDTPSTVTDADLNVYNTIRIGSQTWMAESLKTTKYNDGNAIPTVIDGNSSGSNNDEWAALATGGYCDYSNTPSNSTTYGRLYNWYTVDNNASTKEASNGSKNICPLGWHVPTTAEWTTLTDYLATNLGVSTNAAKALAAKTNWNTSATVGNVGNDLTINNSSGFTALPAGYRDINGTFSNIGYNGSWWSSIASSTSHASILGLYSGSSNVNRYDPGKTLGLSVRCVKN